MATGTSIKKIPFWPKDLVTAAKPKEEITYVANFAIALITPTYLKRLNTGKYLKNIGLAGAWLSKNIPPMI